MIEINNQCVGCAACQNVCRYEAIKMLRNNEGFWYPKINKINALNVINVKKYVQY